MEIQNEKLMLANYHLEGYQYNGGFKVESVLDNMVDRVENKRKRSGYPECFSMIELYDNLKIEYGYEETRQFFIKYYKYDPIEDPAYDRPKEAFERLELIQYYHNKLQEEKHEHRKKMYRDFLNRL